MVKSMLIPACRVSRSQTRLWRLSTHCCYDNPGSPLAVGTWLVGFAALGVDVGSLGPCMSVYESHSFAAGVASRCFHFTITSLVIHQSGSSLLSSLERWHHMMPDWKSLTSCIQASVVLPVFLNGDCMSVRLIIHLCVISRCGVYSQFL